jgi:hypothetical protein
MSRALSLCASLRSSGSPASMASSSLIFGACPRYRSRRKAQLTVFCAARTSPSSFASASDSVAPLAT